MFIKLIKSLGLALVLSSTALASVTISGTRIIFPGANKDVIVKLNNRDDQAPQLVQVWIDDGVQITDINNANLPFILTPPIARIEPNKGQSIRVIYNGMKLPQDRESVYYFNMLEIPSEDTENLEQKLEIAFKTRMKLFYRPASLNASSIQVLDKLQIQQVTNNTKGVGIKIGNPTPYYFSFSTAFAVINGQKVELDLDMVPPLTTIESYPMKQAMPSGNLSEVNYELLNDYGSNINKKLVKGNGQFFSIVD